MDNELENLEQYIEEARIRFESRSRLREINQQDNIDYPSEASLSNLDSSIKKNSAFVKRLKVYSESQKEQIFEEIDRLNLTKFISEVAGSIIEAKLKLSDIQSVIEICTKLNRSYREFSNQLLCQYSKYFPSVKKKNLEPSSNSRSGVSLSHQALVNRGQIKYSIESSSFNPSKIRVDLRLFAELVLSGILPLKESFPLLINLLFYLTTYDRNSHQNANAILTFCRGCGDEYANLVPCRVKELADQSKSILPTSDFIPLKRQELLRNHIYEYLQTLQKYTQSLQRELEELIARSKRICRSKGDISKEFRESVENKRTELLRVQNVTQQLGDLLGERVSFASDYECLGEATSVVGSGPADNIDSSFILTNDKNSIWDDEGVRGFYEDLLNLRKYFPNLTEKGNIQKRADDHMKERGANSGDGQEDGVAEQDESPLDKSSSNDNDVTKSLASSSSEESLAEEDVSQSSGTLVMIQDVANRIQPEQFYNKLSNCVNRDMIDNAAIDFIRFFNTKFGRRKLVKTLFNVQRTRLDLLPFYSRLAATLYPYVPSVGNELVSMLKLDFRSLFKKKDQINIESKVKNVRFIGELVKFELYPKHEALGCLKMLLSDFTHHHIEMACNLLETCGRLLYRSPATHHQLRLLLEQMMRKKLLLTFDSKYVTMIENAYYFTNPPEVVRQVVNEPPVHLYVRYLLCECLNRSTIEKVLIQIKKLDWGDKALARFVVNCMIEAHNLKFYNIRYLAALLATLNKDHQWVPVAVIDGVVEDILLMMEVNELQFNQRRIPMIRYFGELYNYRLSDSSLVFKILYSLITYGVHYHEPGQTLNQIPMSQLDPPDNLFRIKLICDLLETCGQYLNNGQEKRKLDCFLLFFQRYYWCKKHIYTLHPYCMSKSGNRFPASIEYLYNDAIHNLRPTFHMVESYADAIQSAQSFTFQ